MAKVKVRNNETLESALKRFNREVVKAGILKELRDREHYQKPSEVRRKLRKERVRKYTLTGSKKHK